MNPHIIFTTCSDKTVWMFYLLRKGQTLQALWSLLLSVSLLIFSFCPLPHFSLSTNASLCCHSTFCYQTPSLSHLFILSWEPCLSPYSLYVLVFYSPLLLSLSFPWVSCHFLCSQQCILEQAKKKRHQCNIDKVKTKKYTGGSRILHWQYNALVWRLYLQNHIN